MTSFADHPICPDCRASMLYEGEGSLYCANEDCPKVSQSYTLGEIDNRHEANGLRAMAPTINGERRVAGENGV